MMSAIVQAIQGMAAVAWVGGIFFAYMALRPAANATLAPPQRVLLWQSAYRLFFTGGWGLCRRLLRTG